MDPEDFRYRVADDGRTAIGGLTLEEILELEALLWWQDIATDLSRELRLLELFLKHHAAFAGTRRTIDAGRTEPSGARQAREVGGPPQTRRPVRMSQPIQMLRSAVAIGMLSMGMVTVYLIVANL